VTLGDGLAGDDVEVVDDGDAAQVEQVLAGAEVAGAPALPVSDVGQGVLDLDAFAQLGASFRGVLALAQFGQQRFVGVDGHATLGGETQASPAPASPGQGALVLQHAPPRPGTQPESRTPP
jgi:hypothetical protein